MEPTITVIYDDLEKVTMPLSYLDTLKKIGVLIIIIQKLGHKNDLLSGYDDYFISFKDEILAYKQRYHTDRVLWTHDYYTSKKTSVHFHGFGDEGDMFTHFEGKQVDDVTWTEAQEKMNGILNR